MKKLIAFLFISSLVACAAYKPIPLSTADAARAAKDFPGTTMADLEKGKSIFEESCHKCHSLKKPFKKDPATIKRVLPTMAKRAKLDSQQEELVRKYLLTMNPSNKSA